MSFKSYEIREKFVGGVKDAIVDGKLGAGRVFTKDNAPYCSMGHGVAACGVQNILEYVEDTLSCSDSRVTGLTLVEREKIERSNDRLFGPYNSKPRILVGGPSELTEHIQLLEKIPVEEG